MGVTGGSGSLPRTLSIGGKLEVNRLGFGAMRLTGPGIWGEPADPDGCRAVLRRALELGVNLIDTADSYGPDVSERLIAEALHPYPSELVIATKGGLTRAGPSRWAPNGRPEHLRSACEGSLRRLRVDRIDLYQLHRPDPDVPYEESIGALVELREAGKIGLIGISNVGVDELETAARLTDIAVVQNRLNLFSVESLAVLEACERQGRALLAWAPLDSGRAGNAGGALAHVAEGRGVTPAQVALAWLLHRSPAIIPIPGTASIVHLEANVAAGAIGLTDEEVEQLDHAASSRWRSLKRALRAGAGRVASGIRR